MVLEHTLLLHLSCNIGQVDKSDELHKELAIKALLWWYGHPSQIQTLFQVIKSLFNYVLVTIDLQCLEGVFYLIAQKRKISVVAFCSGLFLFFVPLRDRLVRIGDTGFLLVWNTIAAIDKIPLSSLWFSGIQNVSSRWVEFEPVPECSSN